MRDLIREIYNKGREKNGRFVSNSYEMHPKTIFEKELKKTYYLEDKPKQLETVRTLLKEKNGASTIDIKDENRLINYCRNNDIDYQNLKNNRLFYNSWVALGYVRELEIEIYVREIYKEADELIKDSKYKAISYLIDEQFKYHKNLFDSEHHDVIYSDEYNGLIFELLQHKIYEISKIEYEPIGTQIKRILRKPLTWNADKNTLGTLFGLLYKAKIITGTKSDIQRGLTSLFDNISSSSLKKQIGLYTNKSEGRIEYDIDTEDLLKDWIDHIK